MGGGGAWQGCNLPLCSLAMVMHLSGRCGLDGLLHRNGLVAKLIDSGFGDLGLHGCAYSPVYRHCIGTMEAFQGMSRYFGKDIYDAKSEL